MTLALPLDFSIMKIYLTCGESFTWFSFHSNTEVPICQMRTCLQRNDLRGPTTEMTKIRYLYYCCLAEFHRFLYGEPSG